MGFSTAQNGISPVEIVGLIHYTQRILMCRHPNEFSKLSMFWKAEDMTLNRYSGSMYQKRLRDGVMIAPSRGCGIGTHRGKKRKKGGHFWIFVFGDKMTKWGRSGHLYRVTGPILPIDGLRSKGFHHRGAPESQDPARSSLL